MSLASCQRYLNPFQRSFHHCSHSEILPTRSLHNQNPAACNYHILDQNYSFDESRKRIYDDEKSLVQNPTRQIVNTDIEVVQHSVELEPMYEYQIEIIEGSESEAEVAEYLSGTDIGDGKVTVIDSKQPIAGISVGTSNSERKVKLPTLRAARLCENRPVCPNDQCRKSLEVIQQALPSDGEHTGKEMVIFRQKAKAGVWVDVAVDITPKIEDYREQGFHRSAKGKAKDSTEYKPIAVQQLAWFDCTNCGKYKFRYEMEVKGDRIAQANKERKDMGGDKGELVFKLNRLECIKNKKDRSLVRFLERLVK